MSVLMDEETTTVVLDALDFEVPCAARCEHAAEFVLMFRCCRANALLCGDHIRRHRESVERALLVGPVVCGYCEASHRSWDDVVEVVPL